MSLFAVRALHPDSFRSGEWAEVLTTVPARGRDCWLVRFPDGTTDYWVIDDPAASYETLVIDPGSTKLKVG